MTTLINKAAATVSGVVLFCIGCVMAGIGLSVVGFLAMFGLAAVGLALLAAPFVRAAAVDPVEPVETAQPAPAPAA